MKQGELTTFFMNLNAGSVVVRGDRVESRGDGHYRIFLGDVEVFSAPYKNIPDCHHEAGDCDVNTVEGMLSNRKVALDEIDAKYADKIRGL